VLALNNQGIVENKQTLIKVFFLFVTDPSNKQPKVIGHAKLSQAGLFRSLPELETFYASLRVRPQALPSNIRLA
jgi:hypothetical protein